MTDRYSLVRRLHVRKRGDDRHCTRSELLLRDAVDSAELTVIQYEHELNVLWYDVAIWHKDKKILVDLIPSARSDTYTRKLQQEQHAIIWIKPGSVGEMQAQLEMWLMLHKETDDAH